MEQQVVGLRGGQEVIEQETEGLRLLLQEVIARVYTENKEQISFLRVGAERKIPILISSKRNTLLNDPFHGAILELQHLHEFDPL